MRPNFNLNVVEQKPEVPDTSSETKKMTGYKSIDDVAAAAPSNAAEIATPVKSSSAVASSTKAPTGKRLTAEQKKEEEKNKAVEEALSKIGVEMMTELANLPYDAWAAFFGDPDLKLSAEQAKTLADSYFLIAKALKPEQMASWKILIAFAALQNTRIVLQKLREHDAKKREEKKRLEAGGDVPSIM